MTRLRSLATFFLAAILPLVFVQPVPAETIVKKRTTYFTIGGRTAEELDNELSRHGPMTQTTGARHPGATRIKFDGELTYVEKGGRCRIGKATVVVDTHLILPRWKNRKTASRDLGFIWDALSSDIKRHEERHAEIARQHARSLEKSLKALPAMRSCEPLQERVQQLSDRAIEAHDADQMRFDRVESVNFERRLIRILESRLERSAKSK
ncbi:DUF922 domain-containing protein [Ciceribacter sp. L1K23]|nr:DUF922 domain-containing protein [Ciceribacter sp. L1K22]MBR0555272.1 DUF922 domain-containing protein [Ciceribacter sp. L1K23]